MHLRFIIIVCYKFGYSGSRAKVTYINK
uniref:Uncharacterized protein n=1 Tax=Anguilla anguilla TaxID=7936 RepID=A0A0E9XMM5_ANGAN